MPWPTAALSRDAGLLSFLSMPQVVLSRWLGIAGPSKEDAEADVLPSNFRDNHHRDHRGNCRLAGGHFSEF